MEQEQAKVAGNVIENAMGKNIRLHPHNEKTLTCLVSPVLRLN